MIVRTHVSENVTVNSRLRITPEEGLRERRRGEEQPRDKLATFNVTKDEREELDRLAALHLMTRAQYLRWKAFTPTIEEGDPQ